ncbi:hypothetical protein AAE478_000553 [Parahypoxylon ruwenzoriense]
MRLKGKVEDSASALIRQPADPDVNIDEAVRNGRSVLARASNSAPVSRLRFVNGQDELTGHNLLSLSTRQFGAIRHTPRDASVLVFFSPIAERHENAGSLINGSV